MLVRKMQVRQPTVFIDKAKVLANIERMCKKAQNNKVLLRPHFKTHQSATIGEWFRKAGVKAITVSSVEMAEYFAEHGWNDITIAFIVNVRQIEQINALANKITLNLLVDSFNTVEFLDKHLTANVNLWIKVDTGYHRTGINWDDEATLSHLIRRIKNCEKMHFEGLLTHNGLTYNAKSREEIKDLHEDSIIKLKDIQERLFLQGFSIVKLSIGDTPACSVVEDFKGINEIRPGNFVFYDVMQLKLGSCTEEQIAMAVACPVVGKYPERNELVIYGGAVHFSKECVSGFFDNEINYGLIAFPKENGWGKIEQNVFLAKLSQEHGIISAPKDFIEKIHVGDILFVLPIHSCLSGNLHQHYFTLDSKEITTIKKNKRDEV